VLDGIIVTHVTNDSGWGVDVYSSCALIMSGGEISGNTRGVGNSGIFVMLGVEISNNKVSGVGGGVLNHVTFTMSGGLIVYNTADMQSDVWRREEYPSDGDGVYSDGTFTMSGGKISNNHARVMVVVCIITVAFLIDLVV
jgi:hypothetical protein